MNIKQVEPIFSSIVKSIRKPYVTPTCVIKDIGNTEGIIGDIAKFSETLLKKPSSEKLMVMMKEHGLVKNQFLQSSGKQMKSFGETDSSFITDNNSLFLEELIKRFPLKDGDKTNFEVQRLMLYLQDINHSSIPNKKAFLDSFLKDVKELDNILAHDGTKLYVDDYVVGMYTKKAILQAKYNDPERYKDITDLISLYKKGLIPKHNVEIFFPEAQFHTLPKSDMQKLLRGESYYPQFKELSQNAISKLEEGEAFSIGERMFVKTKNGYDELKIDRTTYEKLFPPVERYAISQNQVGNCGKISSWNGMIKNPTSRIELYKCFEQTPNGVKVHINNKGILHDPDYNELIEMPNDGYSMIFDFKNMPNLNTNENLQGCLGHKMLEYTYDISAFSHIDIGGNPRPQLISRMLGVSPICRSGEPVRAALFKKLPQFCDKHKKGIYIKNGCDENLNFGDTDGHFYSTTDLSTGKWQNPWTGIEEILLGKDSAASGSLHDFG